MAVEAARRFRTPQRTLGDLDAETAASVITAAADVAVILDQKGVIRDLAFGADDLSIEGQADWLGQPLAETVTVESQPKVEALLRDAAAKAPPKARQVNHPSSLGSDIPILYSAVEVGSEGRVLALGRDLRPMAALQQRLVDAQQAMERDYLRLRHAETRYRLLFQIASEAVLIVDAATQEVVEANPAAGELLGAAPAKLVGRPFPEGFEKESMRTLRTLLEAVRNTGRAEEVHVRHAGAKAEFLATASLFRQGAEAHFLVRLAPLRAGDEAGAVPRSKSKLIRVVETSPDALVVTAPDGRILSANRAFLDLAQLASEEQARGESLERWLGRSGVDLNVLMKNLGEHGSVRLFATTLQGDLGARAEVEISAVSVLEGEQPCLGFMVRNVDHRLPQSPRKARELPRSVEQLTELVGRVALKDIVRQTTDVIERLCIEAALELTSDNRASAAEMLGLSRQSLYVKLRRYGLDDLAAGSD